MVIPYLSFFGKACEAASFYRMVFNTGNPYLMRFSDAPPEWGVQYEDHMKNWVLHGSISIEGSKVYFCDTFDKAEYGDGVVLNITYDTPEKAWAVFELLKEGGIVTTDFSETYFAKAYGSICDKFGVNWAIICE